MEIEVRLFANLADFRPPGAGRGGACLDLPEGSTVDDLARRLAIPSELPWLALVNGREVGLTARLAPGDVVSLYPPLAGGAGR